MDDARRFFSIEQDIDKHGNRLPHRQQGSVWCFVTWRLADSLPASLFDSWRLAREIWMTHHPEPWDEVAAREYHERFSLPMEKWLDQGEGNCLMRRPECAQVVADALRQLDGEWYELRRFVVMPNHVHVLFHPLSGPSLGEILRSWKGRTARQLNLIRSAEGTVWQKDYWDRLIRNEHHFQKAERYIQENPEKAGLKSGEYLLG